MSNENEKPTQETGEEESKAEATQQEVPQTEETEAPEKGGIGKYVAMVTSLKEEKPLVFYGGIVGILVILLALLYFSGGGGEQVKAPAIQVGQTYKLINPNVTGGGDVLLLQAPGRMGATDPELRDKEQICVVRAGTSARLQEQTVVNYVKYVKVEPLEGDCRGKSGWTSFVNLKQ
ncbi:MAG: hypothetical protein ACPW60_11430 [Methylohalobius sp. ZOD2]